MEPTKPNTAGDGLEFTDVPTKAEFEALKERVAQLEAREPLEGFSGPPGQDGATNLLQLTDTPSTYGKPGEVLTVNETGNGTVWASPND